MIKGLSLFANVGIAEFYLNEIGIEILVANELLDKRANLYKYFHPNSNIICGDITEKSIFNKVIEESKKLGCDFVMATPPCQGMSIAGKMDENDSRNNLIIKAVEIIKKLKPKYGLIENVPGFLTTYIKLNGEKILIPEYIKNELGDFYNIKFEILNSANHGTPQVRKRAFVLISSKKVGKELNFPNKQKEITVKEAIGHLPILESGEKSNIKYHEAKTHNKNHILWMKNTPSGKTAFENLIHYPKKNNGEKIKGFSTTYKRINWDKPAPTITMSSGAISSQNNVHPGRKLENGNYSDARVLTLKELFILTGLPENIEFPDWCSDNFIRQVIGEGVPPLLIKEILKDIKK
ncbi:MAG: DNA cytosine methyltransferase [Candidatus Gracilibacteria bacterium]|nr:DNA cytosine methyltransferase [Candidatus Gracilibacteria bacterium]